MLDVVDFEASIDYPGVREVGVAENLRFELEVVESEGFQDVEFVAAGADDEQLELVDELRAGGMHVGLEGQDLQEFSSLVVEEVCELKVQSSGSLVANTIREL